VIQDVAHLVKLGCLLLRCPFLELEWVGGGEAGNGGTGRGRSGWQRWSGAPAVVRQRGFSSGLLWRGKKQQVGESSEVGLGQRPRGAGRGEEGLGQPPAVGRRNFSAGRGTYL